MMLPDTGHEFVDPILAVRPIEVSDRVIHCHDTDGQANGQSEQAPFPTIHCDGIIHARTILHPAAFVKRRIT